jgi:hypothetical protein
MQQVDQMIVNDSFVAHPRITNPTDVDLRGKYHAEAWTGGVVVVVEGGVVVVPVVV